MRLGAEQVTLKAELSDLETRAQTALLAADGAAPDATAPDETRSAADITPENRELADLERRANIGDIFASVVTGLETDGATRELQTHLGMSANRVPLALLTRASDEELEVRTTGVTPAPADVGVNQNPIIPAVFPMSAAAFMLIPQPTVGVGEATYTHVSTSASPGTPAEGVAQASSAAALTALTLSPAAIQGSVFFTMEDRARLAGMGEALRADLQDALSDLLDQQVLIGSTNGLFEGTNLGDNDAGGADTFASYRTRFAYDAIDGKWASRTGELRLLVGADTYGDMGSTYRGNQGDVDVLDSLTNMLGGVQVSSHVPATVSNKQEAVIRRGARMDAVTPIWNGIEILEDPFTKRDSREIILSAVMLYAHQIIRADGFRKVEAQHA